MKIIEQGKKTVMDYLKKGALVQERTNGYSSTAGIWQNDEYQADVEISELNELERDGKVTKEQRSFGTMTWVSV
ncbi:MAG: hypothetical protein GY788_10350 [bacterium]|nr:hypothetical protein [bacterium]